MTTARLALVLWFVWATVVTALFLARPVPGLTQEDQLRIYAAVIRDFRGPVDVGHPPQLALLDPAVLIPAEKREEANGSQNRACHSRAILRSLRLFGLIRDTCEPEEIRGDPSCRGDLPGPVLALSSIQVNHSGYAVVSILLRTVRTTRQKLYIPFAVEYEYEVAPEGLSWAVTKKKETMIT